ncbi:unnamed protein product, partial [Vitis vinifera]|uniref:Uncharacterized protein n=1 Tax=Vitis vinifera TaxID=29760 RepID=D7UBX4_VITVI
MAYRLFIDEGHEKSCEGITHSRMGCYQEIMDLVLILFRYGSMAGKLLILFKGVMWKMKEFLVFVDSVGFQCPAKSISYFLSSLASNFRPFEGNMEIKAKEYYLNVP